MYIILLSLSFAAFRILMHLIVTNTATNIIMTPTIAPTTPLMIFALFLPLSPSFWLGSTTLGDRAILGDWTIGCDLETVFDLAIVVVLITWFDCVGVAWVVWSYF